MILINDWIVLEKEDATSTELIIPDVATDRVLDDTIFLVTQITEGASYVEHGVQIVVPEVIKVGSRVLLYGLGSATQITLPGGRKIWMAQARYVAAILEVGE